MGELESYVVGVRALYLLFLRRKWNLLKQVGVGKEYQADLELYAVVYGNRINVHHFLKLYPDFIQPAIELVGMYQLKRRELNGI